MDIKAKVSLLAERKTQISLLLTAIALLLWSHSILYAKFEIGYFGLIHGLPVTFFIATAFLTIASTILWVSKESHGKLLLLQLLVLVSALWLIPLVTGGSHPSMDHAYRNLGCIDYIVNQTHFGTNVTWYYSWPGSFVVSAMAVKIGSINLEPVLSLLPLLIQLLYLLPLYVFLKNTLGVSQGNYCWAGCWLFYLAQWVRGGYLSTQGIAFLFLLTLLALVTVPSLWEKNHKSFALLFVIVLVFAALAITHLLTALAALSILAVLCLVKRSKKMVPVVALCLLIVVSWDFSGGAHYIKYAISLPVVTTVTTEPTEPSVSTTERGILILDPELIVQREVTGHFSGSESHIAVAKTRVLFSSIFALIGLAGVILLFAIRRNFKIAAPVLVITLAPLVLLPLSGHYGEELLHRLYLFALPGMAVFGAMLLDTKNKIPIIVLCILLIICCPLHVISHYGNEEVDYFPAGQVVGLHFFDDYTTEGYVTGAFPLGETSNISYYRHLRYEHLDFTGLEEQGDRLTVKVPVQKGVPHYIGISRQDVALYRWFLGNAEFIDKIKQLLDNAENCNFIYSNPDLRLYVKE